MKKNILNVIFAILVLSSHSSQAGLLDVSKIVITPSALNTEGWLQVSEVSAIDTAGGGDLALTRLNAVAIGSSDFPSSNADFSIDGAGPTSFPQIFHSNESDGSSFLNVVLASPSELESITVFGRRGEGSFRDIYNISLFTSFGDLLFAANDLDASGSSNSVSIDLSAVNPDAFNNVPVPAAFWLLGSGLIGLFGMRKNS